MLRDVLLGKVDQGGARAISYAPFTPCPVHALPCSRPVLKHAW